MHRPCRTGASSARSGHDCRLGISRRRALAGTARGRAAGDPAMTDRIDWWVVVPLAFYYLVVLTVILIGSGVR